MKKNLDRFGFLIIFLNTHKFGQITAVLFETTSMFYGTNTRKNEKYFLNANDLYLEL